MKPQQRIKSLVALAFALTSAAAVWWACETNKVNVGPAEPSPLSTAQVLGELANSKTQQETEIAITHLLEKTGVGIPVKGSKYGEYILTDRFVSELATEHLLFRNGQENTTWEEMFEVQKLLSQGDWTQDVDFDGAVARFREEATAALNDPESPNNALLLAMAAKGAAIPETIPLFERTEAISPLQEALFDAWVNYAFGDMQALEKTKGTLKFFFVSVPSCNPSQFTVVQTQQNVQYSSKKQKKCLEKAKKEYAKEVKKCLKKKLKPLDSKFQSKCEKLQDCLEDAHEEVLDDIEDCHDQGSAN